MSLERSFTDRPWQRTFVRTLAAAARRPAERTLHMPVFRDFSGNIFRLAVTMKSAKTGNARGDVA
ncbi:MAG: hypothetical protein ABJL55_17655 [Roseibium sp.]